MDDLAPLEKDENGYYKWDFDKWFASLPPYEQRNSKRRSKVMNIEMWLYRKIPWMRWPILKVFYHFWHCIFEEGIRATCKPRWGAMTFAYLNDGIKPTLWHTLRQITHDQGDKYTGIYTMGAPKNKKQADAWEEKWAKEREDKLYDSSVFV
jgi:hypothetical protein